MTYPKRILVALDQLLAVILFGCLPDETISAMAHRRHWKRMETFINWLFMDDMHCAKSYISELSAEQNAREYRTK